MGGNCFRLAADATPHARPGALRAGPGNHQHGSRSVGRPRRRPVDRRHRRGTHPLLRRPAHPLSRPRQSAQQHRATRAPGYETAARFAVEHPRGTTILYSGEVDSGLFVLFAGPLRPRPALRPMHPMSCGLRSRSFGRASRDWGKRASAPHVARNWERR